MALREISDTGETYDVSELPHRGEFDAVWSRIGADDRSAMQQEINRRLDLLISSPDPNWGSITNTSIEGGKVNPVTGIVATGGVPRFRPFMTPSTDGKKESKRSELACSTEISGRS